MLLSRSWIAGLAVSFAAASNSHLLAQELASPRLGTTFVPASAAPVPIATPPSWGIRPPRAVFGPMVMTPWGPQPAGFPPLYPIAPVPTPIPGLMEYRAAAWAPEFSPHWRQTKYEWKNGLWYVEHKFR